jgi:DNA uptake protein ComE-like DNA-binding protein
MKLHINLKHLLNVLLVGSVMACNSTTNNEDKSAAVATSVKADEYFSVKIDGQLWEAFPSKEFKAYNLSYKEIGHQFSIFAEAEDGSRMDLSFHSHDQLRVGVYPSTRNDNGILSGVFYYPEAKSSDKETASTTMEHPIQENTVQITKIDRSNKTAYIIEGTFSPMMYAIYETNPVRSSKLTEGKFRVIYRPDSMNPAF